MRKEIVLTITALGTAALAGEIKKKNPDLYQPISPADAMSLPGEGMFKREEGKPYQFRGGEWVELPPIEAGANVFDGQTGLTRLTAIEDSSAPESYQFSHFIGEIEYNKDQDRWEVKGCYSTAGGQGCSAVFEVPRGRVNDINQKIQNQSK